MPTESTSLPDAFAAPFVETLADGTELKFLPFDIDHWTETCAGLNAQREQAEQAKVNANVALTPDQRAAIMAQVRKDKFGITYAMWYRRQEPSGIKIGLRRALVAGFPAAATPDEKKKLDEQADALVKRIKPTRQIDIIDYLVDPYPLQLPEKPDAPKAESVSTTASGSETGSSSNDASPESAPEV